MMTSRSVGGFALPMALWACLLMSITMTGLLLLEHFEHETSRYDLVREELIETDDAALYAVIHDLNGQSARIVKRADGSPVTWSFEGRAVVVNVQDEVGKIDLNFAGWPLLYHLFLAAGCNPTDAGAYADRIMDWRESGVGKRLNGAKREDYAAAQLPYAPREASFQSVGEVQLILGMSPTLYEKIRPAITVYSEQPSVDLAVAVPLAYTAVSGRAPQSGGEAQNLRSGFATHLDTAGLVGHAFTITAESSAGGVTVRRRVVVRLTRHARDPDWFYDWK